MTINNEQLTSENLALKTENDTIKDENKQLKTNNDAIKNENEQLKTEIQQLKVSYESEIAWAFHIISYMRSFSRDLNFAEGKSERIFTVYFSLIIKLLLSHCFFRRLKFYTPQEIREIYIPRNLPCIQYAQLPGTKNSFMY